jgi:hypothetical protein
VAVGAVEALAQLLASCADAMALLAGTPRIATSMTMRRNAAGAGNGDASVSVCHLAPC